VLTSRFVGPLLAAALAATAQAQGRIVVAHDEWTLSNTGFAQAATTGAFVQNVAAWFNGGQPGSFRAWSGNFGVTQTSLANAMTGAGHTWTVSSAGTFDLATLQQYDGVFVVGTPVNATVLAQYVQAGGNVYVAAGTGANDPANLNPFLNQFGLSIGALNALSGTPAISSGHPIFAGVASLYQNNGNSITANSPGAQVLVTQGVHGLYAVWDGASGTPATNTILGAGCGGLALSALTRPVLGTNWNLRLTGIPATGVNGVVVFGVADLGIDDLAAAGLPGCGLRATPDALAAFTVTGSTHPYSLTIPSTGSLIGFEVFTTGGVFLNPPTNPFGAITANGIRGILGDV
jgi:hypothetical protein